SEGVCAKKNLSYIGANDVSLMSHPPFFLRTIFLVLLFSQYARNVKFPLPIYKSKKGWTAYRLQLFKMFPTLLIHLPCPPDPPDSFPCSCPQIILAILVSWLLCFIFTVTDVFPPDSSKYGFYARTDARRGVLLVAPWFKVPYPCKCVLPGAQQGLLAFQGSAGSVLVIYSITLVPQSPAGTARLPGLCWLCLSDLFHNPGSPEPSRVIALVPQNPAGSLLGFLCSVGSD
ncbi:hypothetical protein DV515_00018948, partial [Chloebia gouldiae]